MNKIYRIVFNQATQTWTAVAENARAKGKSGRTTVGSSKLSKLMGVSAITAAALLSTQAMAEDTYFHVNTGTNSGTGNATTNLGGVTEAAGATATGAIAAGVNATATAGNTIAIGQGASSAHANSVVIGAGAKSSSLMGFSQATAVGYQANAGNDSVAIGSGAVATGATTTTTYSGWATAIGRAAQATGLGSVAMGNEANASHIGTVAVGPRAAASAREAAAFGGTSSASGYAALAAGYQSKASGAFSSALGAASTATAMLSTANGYSADATGTRSTSIGSESQATANFATALGDSAWATAASSTALGTGARSTGAASLAVGSAAQTQAFQSAAFGSGASVYAGGVQALALGSNATTSNANAVALGSGARTAAAVDTTEATINGVTYGGFAGTAPIATVSVGNDTQKRTITNVAAGRITADSTDAINGSQLYAVASELGGEVSNTYFHVNTGTNRNTGNATTNLGSITDAAGATGYGAVTAGVNARATAAGSLALGQDSYAVGNEAVAIGVQAGTRATMADRTVMIGSQAGNSSNTTNSVLLGWQSAYNRVGSGLVAIGTSAAGASTPLDFDNSLTSSVAIGQSAAFDASGIWNSYIGTMAGSYKQGENNVSIGYYAGAGEIGSSGKKTEAGDTGSIGSNNVAFGYFAGSGVDGDDNIAIGQWANTGANPDGGFIGFNDTVALGRKTVANLDSNIAIGAEAKAATAKGDVALGAGSVTRAVTPTSSATINNVTYGTFAGAEPTSAVSVGAVGSERQIQNVAAGQINATSTDAINGSQLYAVADKLTADIKAADTNTVTTVTAGKNITVKNIGTKDAPNYEVTTADQVSFDGVSITNGPTINNNGINMNGDLITNVAAGVADTDAVNLGQLKQEVNNINQTIVAAKTEVVAGENVTVDATPGANGQAVYTVNAKDTSASVSAGSSAVSVTKGATGKVGTTDVTDYAVDLSQNTKDDIQKGVDANTAVNNKGLTFAGDSGSTDVQKLGSTVGVKGDGNIITSAFGSQINASLNKNLDLGNDGSITTGNTVVNNDGISITNDSSQTVSLTNNGLNNGGNRITNIARGINGTDAVNVDQLNDATSGIYGRIDNLDKDYRAGVAGNAAMVNIPQVTRPGANLLGIGLGHHKGESAVAVGFSSSSDNEQLIFKMSGSANTQGDFTIGSGLGWQW